jgi:hypothetical protein
MKTCNQCDIKKPLDQYAARKNSKDGYNIICKQCANQYYKDNKQKFFNRRKWFYDIKSKLKCERCGFSHPAALDFHHKDPTQKSFGISANKHIGEEKILKEIEKCEVLCANCHRIEHATQYNDSFD